MTFCAKHSSKTFLILSIPFQILGVYKLYPFYYGDCCSRLITSWNRMLSFWGFKITYFSGGYNWNRNKNLVKKNPPQKIVFQIFTCFHFSVYLIENAESGFFSKAWIMVFRLDGCSFHVAHAWRKMGLFG